MFSRGDRVLVRYDISESEGDVAHRGKLGTVRYVDNLGEYGVVLDTVQVLKPACELDELVFRGDELADARAVGAGSLPMYTHDCEACIHLGRVVYDGQRVDLYYCPMRPEDDAPTLLVRRSSQSGDCFMGYPVEACQSSALALAYARAAESGLDLGRRK